VQARSIFSWTCQCVGVGLRAREGVRSKWRQERKEARDVDRSLSRGRRGRQGQPGLFLFRPVEAYVILPA
jgi:hypothetical protein